MKKNTIISKELVREWRKENGITQKQLAELADCSVATICNYEKGKCNISDKLSDKIASIIGTGKILTGQEEKAADDSNQLIEDADTGIDEDSGFSETEIAMIHQSNIAYLGERENDSSLEDEMDDSIDDTEINEDFDDNEPLPESGYYEPASFSVDKKQLNAIKQSAINMASQSKESLKCLVSFYYQYQGQRIANDDRIRKISKGMNKNGNEDSMLALKYLADSNREMEKQLKAMLGAYSVTTKVGKWLNDIVGIGPCISAGLLAYFNISENMRSCQSFYNYAGLNDNNIPWLSKDDVKKVMNKADEIISARVEERKAAYETFQNPKWKSYMKKLATTNMDQAYASLIHGYSEDTIKDSIIGIIGDSDTAREFVDALVRDCEKYQYGPRTWYNTIVYEFNAKEPSPEYMVTIAILTNRTYKNIFNGAIDRTKNGNDRRTYDRLARFLNMPPYLKELKVLCFKIEDSFAKQISRGSLYGKLYKQRKEYELKKNDNGDYADIALRLAERTSKKDLKKFYLEEKKLTNKHIDRRARRWACKIFISHLFDAMYIDAYGRTPDLPTVFNSGNHLDFIAPEVPYSKYWGEYEDKRNYANISLEYTPDYTYSYEVNNVKDWADILDQTTPKKVEEGEKK